jgi:hypothetical protein
MLLLLVLIVLFGISTQYRDGFKDEQDMDDQSGDMDDQGSDQGSDQDPDDQDSMDSNMSSMSSLRRQLPPMVSSCVKDGLRQFDDLQ